MKFKLPITETILVAAIVLLVLVVFYQGCVRKAAIEGTIKGVRDMQKVVHDSTTYWRDKYDQEHAEKFMLEGDIQELKSVYEEMITKKARELKVKEKQILSMTNFNSRQRLSLDSLVKIYAKYDTTFRKGQNGGPDTQYIVMSVPNQIDIKDSIGVTQYLKKEGFLGLRKNPYIDIVNYTNGGSIGDIQGFRVKTYEPTFRIRPTASILYLGDGKWTPAAGAGVEFRVFKVPVFISVQKAFP